MSIPRPDPAVPSAPAQPADLFDTGLIARLANEFFSESGASAKAGTPTAPKTVAGLPDRPTSPTSLPEAPHQAPSGPDLSGGFPTPSSSTPVHPIGDSPAPAREPEEVDPRSGGHDPDSDDSYAFGEPRCYSKSLRAGQSGKPSAHPSASPTQSHRGSSFPFGSSSIPFDEPAPASEFYFLNEQPPAHGPASSLPGLSRGSTTPALSVFDVAAVRRDFPALHQRVNGHPLIWLDNAATTHKPQSVIDATSQFYGRDNSNIHRAAHVLAGRATELFESGREKVRQFLGAADAREIVFVRGTTEGINLVAQTYGRKNIGQGDEIIVTELEHHANIVPWQLLAEQVGAVIRVVPINDRGELVMEKFVRLLGPRTKFVSVAHVSNSLGTVNPVEQIIPLAHARGVPVLIDGAQSTPHLPVNVTALDADFYVFSAHKIFGPTGIGALYGKSSLLESMPPYQGGGHMIRDVSFEKTVYQHPPEKFEAGTPDIAGVVGLGAAIDYLTTVGIPALAAYEHSLLDYATEALATIPGLRPIGTARNKASVLSFVIPGIPNANIAKHLDHHGIAVRAGHHCAMPAQRHFGVESTVRPSLAFYNTQEEVDTLVRVLRQLPRP
jgi:cysteine desulfurase/selenocysteine lyase